MTIARRDIHIPDTLDIPGFRWVVGLPPVLYSSLHPCLFLRAHSLVFTLLLIMLLLLLASGMLRNKFALHHSFPRNPRSIPPFPLRNTFRAPPLIPRNAGFIPPFPRCGINSALRHSFPGTRDSSRHSPTAE